MPRTAQIILGRGPLVWELPLGEDSQGCFLTRDGFLVIFNEISGRQGTPRYA